jgi:hypothetical protein
VKANMLLQGSSRIQNNFRNKKAIPSKMKDGFLSTTNNGKRTDRVGVNRCANTKIVSISKYFLFYVRWLRFLRLGVTFVEVI